MENLDGNGTLKIDENQSTDETSSNSENSKLESALIDIEKKINEENIVSAVEGLQLSDVEASKEKHKIHEEKSKPIAFQYIQANGAGGCLFVSCGHHLGIGGMELRNKVCDTLEFDKERYIGAWDIAYILSSMDDPDQYIRDMRNPDTHGDFICVAVIGSLYDVCIRIMCGDDVNNPKYDPDEIYGGYRVLSSVNELSNRVAYIHYNMRDHYDILVPLYAD